MKKEKKERNLKAWDFSKKKKKKEAISQKKQFEILKENYFYSSILQPA